MRVLIRTDGAGSSHAFLARLTDLTLSNSIGFGLPDDIADRRQVIPEIARSLPETGGFRPRLHPQGR